MNTVTPAFVRQVIDFAPTELARGFGFAEQQQRGTTALFNMLQRNRCAYLADEVGMGKTYVALGIMALTRYFNPHARIVVVAPRENIQRKWIKELKNFVRLNWQLTGNRVKSLQDEPAWAPVYCPSLVDFVGEAPTQCGPGLLSSHDELQHFGQRAGEPPPITAAPAGACPMAASPHSLGQDSGNVS